MSKIKIEITDIIITLTISWIPTMRPKASKAEVVPSEVLTTTRANWIENNTMADSIMTNMIDQSLLPPLMPKDFSSEVVVYLTSRNTLKILNTIKHITRAFTVIDMTRLVIASVLLSPETTNRPSTLNFGTTLIPPPIQVARGNQFQSVNE
jgi:hypothetical protein